MRTTRRTFIGSAALAAGTLAGLPAGAPAQRRAGGAGAAWLAGDLHVHSHYSHDVWRPGDDNTGLDEAYTAGFTVAERFSDARVRGLDYLAVTDHDDVRSVADLPTGGPVVALPGYEMSVRGHAHLLGTARLHDKGDSSAVAVSATADAVRAEGGLLQANHPAYRLSDPDGACRECACSCGGLHWSYGFDVVPDTIETWNPSAPPNEVAEAWWECWLDRGHRIPATGGSDSHWATLDAVAGPGQPTTWVLARERTAAAILEALRAGRVSISGQPPALGGPRLDLAAADGSATIGDDVAPGTTLRVRAEGELGAGLVQVRAGGEDLLEEPLVPGGEVTFAAPDAGWVRATLLGPEELRASTPDQQYAQLPERDGRALLATTSPVYVR
jgi:hypothetical protein